MAKDKDERARARKIEKPLNRFNKLYTDMMDRITGSSSQRDRELERLVDEIDDIVEDDLGGLRSLTGGYYSTFLTKLFNDQDNDRYNANKVTSIDDIFAADSGEFFTFFQERYKNQNLLYEDLQVICSQLYEMMEAINATRDAVVTSDDISKNVSRNITFRRHQQDTNDREGTKSVVENMEHKFQLLGKIKDHIVPKTLQYGKYYAYTVPYAAMFQQHYNKKVKDEAKFGSNVTLENFTEADVSSFRSATDLTDKDIGVKETLESFRGVSEHIQVYTDENLYIPMVENTHFGEFMNDKFKDQVDTIMRKNKKDDKKTTVDGVVDVNDDGASFSEIKDCYIKLIDPSRIIPIKIMDEILGYYYVHQMDLETSKTPFSNTLKISSVKQNSRDLETAFLSRITDKVVKAFNKKYLEDNAEFKELILNSLIFNDVYKKQIKFQFIPKEYITEFNVNKDENGNGRSVLLPSLFYAKLYLSLLIFKMITIVSRSNDTKIYYIRNSGIETDIVNQVQRTAMDIKSRQINFNDLLNYNSMMGKIGQMKDIFMPVGSSGEKAIDFDILAGQDVELNNELMTMLRTGAINATGVPSVITEHLNDAEYARTLIMANAKFLGRAVTYQLELNPSISEFYRKILRFTTSLDATVIDDVEFSLSAPKALASTNMSDLISSTQQIIDFMISTRVGESSTPTEDDNKTKDIAKNHLSQEMLPMLPWNSLDEIMKKSAIDLETARLKAKSKATGSTEEVQ